MLALRMLILGPLAVALLTSVASAQPEKIPAPKVQLPQPVPQVYIEPYVVRPGSRDVWQHYGVNSLGRFVPRVIVFPEGAYYSRNLQPYPWVQNRPAAIMPYVVD